MTNDLLPDVIYVEAVIRDDVTGEGEIIGWTEPSDDGDPDTKYIRADLVSAPNKSAEVDLDALKAEIIAEFKGSFHEMNRAYPDGYAAAMCREMCKLTVTYLSQNGHLATGKGGGDLEADTKKVIHLLDNGWKPVFNPPYEDTKYTLSKLPEGIISSAGFEKLSFEDAVTVQGCLEKLARAHLSKLSGG